MTQGGAEPLRHSASYPARLRKALDVDTTPNDYDAVLQANLARVFSESDPEARAAALADLWSPDGELVEPDRIIVGHAAINAAVGALLAQLPPGTRFAAQAPARGHHGLGRLNWQALGPDGGLLVTGTDVALFRDGRIERLYVLLDG